MGRKASEETLTKQNSENGEASITEKRTRGVQEGNWFDNESGGTKYGLYRETRGSKN